MFLIAIEPTQIRFQEMLQVPFLKFTEGYLIQINSQLKTTSDWDGSPDA
jgi:hypothetical protein